MSRAFEMEDDQNDPRAPVSMEQDEYEIDIEDAEDQEDDSLPEGQMEGDFEGIGEGDEEELTDEQGKYYWRHMCFNHYSVLVEQRILELGNEAL